MGLFCSPPSALAPGSMGASVLRGVQACPLTPMWPPGEDFDGLVVFDESHKAKNLVPEAGSKPTKVGAKVMDLQQRLPKARVVYCSATGERSFIFSLQPVCPGH